MKEVFSPVVAAILIAAILGAITSTADSVLLTGVAYVCVSLLTGKSRREPMAGT